MAAAVLAAAFLFIWTQLPPHRVQLPGPAWPTKPMAAGAFHVHSNLSDGSGSRDEVAAAAARAGLQFIIFADHGDGTRPIDPPRYRAGVLCIDGVEISTEQGHYIAVDMRRTPFPLGGEPRDVVEDVRRFGGFGVVAHPDSAKAGLQWRDWSLPVDGIEWLNADSEWRDETRGRLLRAVLEYPLRPVETLGSLLDRPEETLARWDALTRNRRVVALAGADAHARVGTRENEAAGLRSGWFVRIPSYEASFGAFSVHATLERPLSGDAAIDAAQVIAAIRQGHIWSGTDAVAHPAVADFSANGARSGGEGDRLAPNGPTSLTLRVNALAGVKLVLRRDGQIVSEQSGPQLTFGTEGRPGIYRAEVFIAPSPGQPPIPWVLTNPIYLQPEQWGSPTETRYPSAIDRWPVQGGPWHVEKDSGTQASLTAPSAREPAEVRFRLAGPSEGGQYAALALSTGNALRGHARLSFRGWASSPMRVSVQTRRPTPGQRWQRSIYLDTQPREIVVPFSEMTPVGQTSSTSFDPSAIDTILFVVDTTNTAPGSTGSFSIAEMHVEH